MTKSNILLITLVYLLVGCSSVPREDLSVPMDINNDWSMSGRLHWQNKTESVSGRFTWSNQAGAYVLTIKSNLPSYKISLKQTQDAASIKINNEPKIYGKELSTMLMQHFGWEIPLTNLRSWLLITSTNAKIDLFSCQQGVTKFRQGEWDVVRRDNHQRIPSKMSATNNAKSTKLKLVINSVQML